MIASLVPTMTGLTDISDLSSFSGTLTPNNKIVGLPNHCLPQSSRHMLDLTRRLYNAGVNVDNGSPLVAVIGQQGAGKSSLIEGISGITLPRAAGACTRCPTICHLSNSSNEWNCKVFIQITTKDGKTSVEQFGDIITSKPDVEDRVRRAQWAILSPAVLNANGLEYFLNGDKHGEHIELAFSTNLVSLEIHGSDLADVSFCDLPGLISSDSQEGNADDINLITDLVESYIKQHNCLIALAISCEIDFNHQRALELAKTHDPLGKRTIGVLTKPDCIPAGQEDKWISLVRNGEEPLGVGNGWYPVKQPSAEQTNKGISWSEARQIEADFFKTATAWKDLDPAYERYLQTENLIERLSSVLSDLIFSRLPEIQIEIENTITSTQNALKALPKALSDPRNEIASRLHAFAQQVQGAPEEHVARAICSAQDMFRRTIRMTSPEFQPYHRNQKKLLGKIGFLEEEEDSGDLATLNDNDGGRVRGAINVAEDHSYTGDVDGQESANGTEKHDDAVGDDGGRQEPTDAAGECYRPTGREIYLDEILDLVDRSQSRILPGTYPYIVQESYVKSFVSQWLTPAKILYQTVGPLLEGYVQTLVHNHFKSFGQGALEQQVKTLVQRHLKKCEDRVRERVEWLYELENDLFTLHTQHLASYQEKFLTLYVDERDKDTTIRDATKEYNAEFLFGLIGNDGSALVTMANVRAYFEVAYKRFSDSVALAVNYELVRGIGRDVLQMLNTGLGINGPDGYQIYQSLAQESPAVEARRNVLGEKLKRMYNASDELCCIGRRA